MKQLYGVYNLNTNEYVNKSVDTYNFENEFISLSVFGRIMLNNKINCGEEIASRYFDDCEKFTEAINGVYIVLFYDKRKNKINIFHDRSTSSVVMYYTECDNKIYFGTSLKKILLESKIKRELNEAVVEQFMLNGFLYGQDTLIRNVYKIKAFHYLEIYKGRVNQNKTQYPIVEMTKGQALDKFKETLDKAIEDCIDDNETEVNLPLSSGYDSNYNAYVASENTNAQINAFSIGGRRGKNELPIVENNIQYYKRMKLYSALTDENTLAHLPDIVWRLEGAVFEVGLPLQYELASLVAKHNKKTLICGEVADQVMNKYYLQPDRLEIKNTPFLYEFSEYPFVFGNYLILKKNGILANSFGIETRYPYLDNDFISVCNALADVNMQDKRVHISNCNECLPEEVLANMTKIGGSTDCHSMFESQNDMKIFIRMVEKCDFYKKHLAIIEKNSYTKSIKLKGIDKAKNDIRTEIFDILKINKSSRDKSRYFNEEMNLRECFSIAYLSIFEKLFIDGDYNFNKNEITLTFDDLFNG